MAYAFAIYHKADIQIVHIIFIKESNQLMKKLAISFVILTALGITACSISSNRVFTPPKMMPPKSIMQAKVTRPKSTLSRVTIPPKVTEPETVVLPKVTAPLQTVLQMSNIEQIPVEDNIFSENTNYKGTGFNYPTKGGTIDIVGRTANITDKNFFEINDYLTEIFPAETNTNTLNLKSKGLTKLAVRNEHTLWAVINDKSQDFVYIIANGVNPTANINGLSGNVTYQGSGYHGYLAKDGSHNIVESVVYMTVNFDNKTVTGVVDSDKNTFKEVEFGAYITDNAFQGKMNGVITQGGFFDINASEVIVQYQDVDGQSFGVFGVKKQ